jgi:hypothetical protein
MEIFFEAVQLKEIGQLERADVAAVRSNFTLEISDDPPQRVASASVS